MNMSIVTQEDLKQFKTELLLEIRAMIPQKLQEKRIIRSHEVCALLGGISTGKLQKMRDSGKIPYTRFDGIIFYDRQLIEQLITKDKSISKKF